MHTRAPTIRTCAVLRMSGRIESVAQRVSTAVKMQTMTASISGVVKGMDEAMKRWAVTEQACADRAGVCAACAEPSRAALTMSPNPCAIE
jgi:hypothetical protein